jgi:multiple sugar transport system ATP-binding protein
VLFRSFQGRIVRTGDGLCFTDGGAISVPLLPALAQRVESRVDKAVKLGVRPEMICDKQSAHDWPLATIVKAKVEVVEALGDLKVVHFSTPKNSFIGKVDAHVETPVGGAAEVAFNASKIHIFDTQTGENLTCTVPKYEEPKLADLPVPAAAGA